MFRALHSVSILAIIASTSISFAYEPRRSKSRSEQTVKQNMSDPSSISRFNLGIGYGLPSKIIYPNTVDNLSVNPYSTETTYAESLNIELGYGRVQPQSFGYNVGLNYQFTQTLSKVLVDGVTLANTDTKIQLTTILFEGLYRDEIIFIPVGLTYTLLAFIPRTGYNGTYDAKSGLGGRAGLGFMINDAYSLQLLYQITPASLNTTVPSTGYIQNFGSGTLTSMNVLFKIHL